MKASAGRKSTKSPKRLALAKGKKPVPEWSLRLYIAGQTPKSLAAFSNLKKICEARLPNQYVIEVIDLKKQPELAQNDQIVALPTLVRKLPEPLKRVIGDLSNLDRVIVGMDLKPIQNT